MAEGCGLLEVYGLTAALVCADAACKAANVRIEAIENNKPANADKLDVPVIILVKLRGEVAELNAAVEAGKKAASEISGVVASHIIARPEEGVGKLLKINAVK